MNKKSRALDYIIKDLEIILEAPNPSEAFTHYLSKPLIEAQETPFTSGYP
jgi:hypothetical protein